MVSDKSHLSDADSKYRRATNIFIAVFIVIQILVPLRYYFRGPQSDQRFCWRMFSGETSNQLAVIETVQRGDSSVEQLVRLQHVLPSQWIKVLYRRNEPVVIRAFLRWYLQSNDVQQLRYVSECRQIGEDDFQQIGWTIDGNTLEIHPN
ncbi:MAG: hypothetical protein N2C12_04115 [Planctomycetales bacterium]